jgi:hypothetical protein
MNARTLADFLPQPGSGSGLGRPLGFRLGQDGALIQRGALDLLAWPARRPLVSCLMVTRGRLFPSRFAVDCFLRQSWAERELVLVCDGPGTEVETYCRALGDARIRIVYPEADAVAAPDTEANPPSLGALRNLALRAARGEWICQWDDDDLYHPQRIEIGMLMLQSMQADALFLSRWMLWAPAARRIGVSGSREWEGSMLARRTGVPAYPALARGEDTAVMHAMLGRGRVVLLDAPWLYTYVQTGANTWTAHHFEAIWQAASFVEAPERYDAALAAMAACGPHADYARAAERRPP